MCYKLDRSLLGVLVAVMLVAPPVYALSDDVAVQLLDRLNDLEGEVSALRSENENLKDKLDGAPTREDDENQVKAEAEKASTEDVGNVEEQAKGVQPAGTTTEQPIPGVNLIVEDAVPETTAQGLADIPPLEQTPAADTTSLNDAEPTNPSVLAVPDQSAETAVNTLNGVTESAVTTESLIEAVSATPALVNASAPIVTAAPLAEPTQPTTPATAPTSAVTTALTNTAVKPIEQSATVNASTTAEVKPTVPVDPKSKDSYYYYGTTESEKNTELKPATAAIPAANTPTASTASPDQERKAKADYNQAYQLLVSKPAEAVPLFRGFLATYPQHELAANAQYWLAEALYAQKDYQGASQEFMKVLKQYKDSPKSSGAALKLGYSFYELQQWEYARRTLEDTVRFFPDSSSAKLAEARLQKMKDEGH
ncbi:MAG TPA: tol-pal system protein YbgF [Thiolinea sp.]|nr:tol-pal system protein YbgF [Thiolinea sp.]